MEAIKFKTNIKCAACVAKVTPALDETVGVGKWEVNLVDPIRTLTVDADANSEEIVKALKEVGYEAEEL
jgi:copper chaperone CopZ